MGGPFCSFFMKGDAMVKKLVLIFFLSYIMLSILGHVNDYDIKSADFDVVLDEEGNALIHEIWVVNQEGKRYGFTKEVANPVYELKYDSLEVLDFKIDGKPCNEVVDNKYVTDNTYFAGDKTVNWEDYKQEEDLGVEVSEPILRHSWFKQAENEEVVYEATYKLNNVVKQIDEDSAGFRYEFLNKYFRSTIDKLNITIKIPDKIVCNTISTFSDGIEKGPGYINYTQANRSGELIFDVKMPLSVFKTELTEIPMRDMNRWNVLEYLLLSMMSAPLWGPFVVIGLIKLDPVYRYKKLRGIVG